MVYSYRLTTSSENPLVTANAIVPKIQDPSARISHFRFKSIVCSSSHRRNPNTINENAKLETRSVNPICIATTPGGEVSFREHRKSRGFEETTGLSQLDGHRRMLALCGFGYWMQGFRCFPWLGLNFHMAHNLSLHPSTLQLVQNSANFPMVAKPLYGILSDALYIGGARRIPYISIGVLLQVLSWGLLALIPVEGKAITSLMACILLSNLGASITEVAKDALVAEYGKKHRIVGPQSYTFMASAAGGILGNFIGGYFLLKAPARIMFLVFSALLSLQLAISLSTREESLGLSRQPTHSHTRKSMSEKIRKQISDLMMALSDNNISRPLAWIVASIAMVPILSGSIFCYQTQCLHLDPSVIGMSRVIGQVMLLFLTVLYDRCWKEVPMRKLVCATQVLYASSLLLDLILVRQINVRLGIPNEMYALCFSGLAETLAQFKVLPFSVLLTTLCPRGCEGSLTSFLASAWCLSSIVGGFLGVGLSSLLGITSADYSRLTAGILIQFLAALLPLVWISHVPMSRLDGKERKRGMSKRTRKNRRVGKVVVGSLFAFRRERESEAQK